MNANLTFDLRLRLGILLGFFFSTSAFAAEIQDISFSLGSWTYTSGATYDPATDELTIIGNASTYEYARYTINLPGGTTNIFLSADIYLENIALGALSYYAPKLKISKVGGAPLQAANLSSPAQGSWYNSFVQTNASGLTQVILEFGFQNSTGTFRIKNPKITDTQPVPTPYSFPYPVPTDPVCTIDLLSSDVMNFNNDLLSTNSHFSWASKSWGDIEVINGINNYFPMTNYRFPGGTVGNFYDWTTDGYKNDPSTFDNPNRTSLYGSGFKFGYSGLKNQVLSNSASTTLMFNVLTDDINTSKNRLQSRLSDGVNVKWVELGNENFYSNQSYGYIAGGLSQVSDVNEYINFTSSLVPVLKAASPSTKFAVCINQHDFTPGSWSKRLSTETYYDATTIHNYNNVGSTNLDFGSGVVLFDSYRLTRKNIQNYKLHFGNTPTLFSEWGVLGSNSFLSVLSAADMFLAILEGNTADGVVMQAGIHMLYHSDNNVPQTLMFMQGGQMKYSPIGAFYSKLYDVFKGQVIYKALSSSDEIDPKLPGVISRAVQVGDSIKVFSVNKLPVASKLNISLDYTTISGSHKIEVYSMSPELWPSAYSKPSDAWTTSINSGDILLPAYSITVVTIAKNNMLPLNLIQFTGKENSNYNELNWITNFERNNHYFQVERSEDGIHFEAIGLVQGAGNSSEIISYKFTDFSPSTGANYYRLKQIDFDSSFTYSNTIKLNERISKRINVSPNPSNGSFDITISNATDGYTLELINLNGNVLFSQNGKVHCDKVTISNLTSGVYILRLISGGEIVMKKVEVY